MATPFPRLTTPKFFVPEKHFVFSLSGTKNLRLQPERYVQEKPE
jgi:hypothetical protein